MLIVCRPPVGSRACMDLLNEIQQRRRKQAEKQPLQRDAFSQVCCIVQRYGLGQDFLNLLDGPHSPLATRGREKAGARLKAPLDCPPFSLGTEGEYELTLAIIRKVGNPYLQYATSPDEILLSNPLYRCNAAIPVERLMRFHFETLLHYELSKSAARQESRHGTYPE